MPLSTQTWSQSALGSPAGSGDTVEEVLAAVKLLIDNDSNWTATSDGTNNSPAYLEISSANNLGAANQKFRILLAEGDVNAAWTVGGSGNWAEAGDLDYTVGSSAFGTDGDEDIYVGYVAPPSNGTSSTAQINTSNVFNSTGPYGGTAASDLERFSSYVKVVDDVSDTGNNRNISKVWLLSCTEMLTIAFEDTNGRIKFVHAGAIIAPLSDSAGETISNNVGRIYGMCTAHVEAGIEALPAAPVNTFWSNMQIAKANSPSTAGGFTPVVAATDNKRACNSVMIIHYPESNALDAAFNFWSGVDDLDGGTTSANATGVRAGSLLDMSGNVAAMPIPIVDGSIKSAGSARTSRQLVGIMRQVKLANPSICRSIVQDATGNIIGFTFTGSRSEAAQGFLHTNS
jgi:hypothetical protein